MQTTSRDHTGRPLAEEAFDLIVEEIISGKLGPGERLRDGEIASVLRMSRTPIREACKRLERAGLVQIFPARWTEVTTPTALDIRQAIEYAMALMCSALHRSAPALNHADRIELAHLLDQIAAAAASNAKDVAGWAGQSARWLADHHPHPLAGAHLREARFAMERALGIVAFTPAESTRLRVSFHAASVAVAAGDPATAEQQIRLAFDECSFRTR